ncbi:hypothetical protein HR09_03690 [Porphyromonas gulae]|nr:hypothetical protein HR09_03690 [Porphyromonas gulae]
MKRKTTVIIYLLCLFPMLGCAQSLSKQPIKKIPFTNTEEERKVHTTIDKRLYLRNETAELRNMRKVVGKHCREDIKVGCVDNL